MNVRRNARPLLARDLMVARVHTVRADERIYDVVKMLVKKGISGAPVVDDRRRVIGMLSERDGIQALMRAVVDDLPSSRVRDVMDPEVTTVPPETHLLTVAHVFLTRKLRRLPVVDHDRRLVGQISRRDLLRKAIEVFDAAPNREAAILYLSAFEGTFPPTS